MASRPSVWSCSVCSASNSRLSSLVCASCQSLRRPDASVPVTATRPSPDPSRDPSLGIAQDRIKRRRLAPETKANWKPQIKLTGTQVSLQTLLSKDSLQKAFFSTFCLDSEWLQSLLPLDRNVCFALHRRGPRSSGVCCASLSSDPTRSSHRTPGNTYRNTLYCLLTDPSSILPQEVTMGVCTLNSVSCGFPGTFAL